MQRISDLYFDKNKEINIIVKTIESNIYSIKINPEKSILDLKEEISKIAKIGIKNQRLIYQGKVLKDIDKIKDYKIYNEHVIHLVKQEEPSNTISNNTNNNDINISNNNNDYLRDFLGIRQNRSTNMENDLNSYQNYFNNILSSLNNINPSNSIGMSRATNLIYHPEQTIIIPESVLNLTKDNYNKVDSIETIKQNINNIKELNKLTELIDESFIKKESSNTYKESKFSKYKIGQWVDVQDSINQWMEGQIITIQNDKLLIHYNSRPSTWDEWIDLQSPRISMFRTNTLQSPYNKFFSPSPNTRPESNLILADAKNFEDFDNLNDIIDLIDILRDKVQKCIIEKESLAAKKSKLSSNSLNKEEIFIKEKILFMLYCQTAPFMDRVGRLITDFSHFLQNYTFEFFSANLNKFNVNLNSNSVNLNLQTVVQYQKLSRIPCMRTPGEIVDSNNLRPRIGIIVTQRSPLQNNNTPIQNIVNNTQNENQRTNPLRIKFDNLFIEAKSNFTLHPRKMTFTESSCQANISDFQQISNVINFSLLKSINNGISHKNIPNNTSTILKISEENLNKIVKKNEKLVLDIVDKKLPPRNDLILKKGYLKINESIDVNKRNQSHLIKIKKIKDNQKLINEK